MPNRKVDLKLAGAVNRGLGYLMAPLLLLIGGLILAGGPKRLRAAPAWDYTLGFPGGHYTWGIGFLVVGFYATLALFLGGEGRRVTFLAFTAAGAFLFILGCFFFAACLARKDASLVGPVLWWFLAILYSLRGLLYSRWLTVKAWNPSDE